MLEKFMISKGMEVLGSDGTYVGVVEHIDSSQITVGQAGADSSASFLVSTSLIGVVHNNAVTLLIPSAEALGAAGIVQSDPQMSVAANVG